MLKSLLDVKKHLLGHAKRTSENISALCFKRNEVLNSNSLYISNTCTNIRNKRDVVPVKAQHC